MTRLLFIFTVLVLAAPSWAVDYCFNFRATSGFVTDTGGCVPVLNEAYPHTYSNGATAGWEQTSTDGTRDRGNTVDPKLAGQNRANSTDVFREFRVDLPSTGSYDIRAAVGDLSFGYATNRVNPYASIKDTTTTLFTIVAGDTSIAAGEFYDATGVKRTSAANWVSANAAKNLTFSTTIFRLRIEAPTALDYSPLAHVQVTTAGGGGPDVTKFYLRRVQ